MKSRARKLLDLIGDSKTNFTPAIVSDELEKMDNDDILNFFFNTKMVGKGPEFTGTQIKVKFSNKKFKLWDFSKDEEEKDSITLDTIKEVTDYLFNIGKVEFYLHQLG